MTKNILLTGISKGLGLETAHKLLSEGYHIYGISRSKSPALENLLKNNPDSVKWVSYDLSNPYNIKNHVFHSFLKDVVLHGFVNNAAMGDNTMITNIHLEPLEKMIRLNLTTPMVLTKYVLRNMLLHRIAGSIVHISSVSVHTGYKGLAMYAATKGALEAFSKNTAREWGSIGIRSNCIAAGFMETDMTAAMTEEHKTKINKRNALKKSVDLSSVAGTVSFLLSDEASSITGQVIGVDAGAI